ncbi:hypothetical protein PAMP_002858 [Pampus punctatissimus]
MAFASVWNYCVPLTIITIACLVRIATDRGWERRGAGSGEVLETGLDGGKRERRQCKDGLNNWTT